MQDAMWKVAKFAERRPHEAWEGSYTGLRAENQFVPFKEVLYLPPVPIEGLDIVERSGKNVWVRKEEEFLSVFFVGQEANG